MVVKIAFLNICIYFPSHALTSEFQNDQSSLWGYMRWNWSIIQSHDLTQCHITFWCASWHLFGNCVSVTFIHSLLCFHSAFLSHNSDKNMWMETWGMTVLKQYRPIRWGLPQVYGIYWGVNFHFNRCKISTKIYNCFSESDAKISLANKRWC